MFIAMIGGINFIIFLLRVQVYLLNKEEGGREKPVTRNFQAQMYCKTWDVPALMELPEDKDMVMPGEDTTVNFILKRSMVSRKAVIMEVYPKEHLTWFLLLFSGISARPVYG